MDEVSQGEGHSLWGGRFSAKPAEIMRAINASIGFDRRLAAEDIAGSKAHAAMLAAVGVITAEDEAAIQAGLDQIAGEIARGEFVFREELEDIHMNVEARLTEIIGPAAGRLHTARSRNDQVALDVRLWTRAACDRARRRARGAAAGAACQGGGARGRPDARLHPPAVGPAGHLRPPPDGLCGDVRPRRRPLRATRGRG